VHDNSLSYLKAWEDFLPPNAVVMAKRRPAEAQAETSSNLRFGFEVPGLEDAKVSALFDKILAALELTPGDYEVFSRTPEGFRAAVTIRFSAKADESVGVWESRDGLSYLTTYSLQAMLADPSLKKPVWAHLKDAVNRAE
jgi:hypothetical protein